MADISKIKINNAGYDIKDAVARAGFAYASVVRINTDEDLQTRLVFYKDSAKTQELGSIDISYMNLEGLAAKQVFVGEGVTTPTVSVDNLEDGIADSTAITVKKVNGKPVFVFSSTVDGALTSTKTEVTLPVGASGEVALKSQVDAVADDLAALVGTGDVSAAIDSFNEVVTFLNGIDKTDPTLANQLLGINNRIDAIEADSAIQGVKVNGTELSPDADKKVSFSAVTGLQFDGSTHVGVVQLPEYVKKSDYDTTIYVKQSDYNTTIDDIYQSIPSDLADLADDENHRVVTDAEKRTWSNKQDALTFDNRPTKSSANPVKSGGVYSALADLYDGYDSTTETLSFTFPTE